MLSAGALINVAMGSVGVLLVMTGHERHAAIGIGISMVANVVLNAILIPQWGLEGAAAATASTKILCAVLLAILVYKKLGIYSPGIGRSSLRGDGE